MTTVQNLFDRAASSYDYTRKKYIPRLEEYYGTVVGLIPMANPNPRILDVGAGTGLLSAMVLAAFPDAQLTLIDISPSMLEQAEARFAERNDIVYQVVDVERDALTGQYDMIISALALHHVPQSTLPRVFGKIFDVLVAGGLFINADQTLGTSPQNEQRYADMWERGARSRGATDAEIATAIERMKADQTATLEDQLLWLRNAGFAHVDCWYKDYRFAVYSGQKP